MLYLFISQSCIFSYCVFSSFYLAVLHRFMALRSDGEKCIFSRGISSFLSSCSISFFFLCPSCHLVLHLFMALRSDGPLCAAPAGTRCPRPPPWKRAGAASAKSVGPARGRAPAGGHPRALEAWRENKPGKKASTRVPLRVSCSRAPLRTLARSCAPVRHCASSRDCASPRSSARRCANSHDVGRRCAVLRTRPSPRNRASTRIAAHRKGRRASLSPAAQASGPPRRRLRS